MRRAGHSSAVRALAELARNKKDTPERRRRLMLTVTVR